MTRSKLDEKCVCAFKNISDDSIDARIGKFEKIQDFSFALLLKFIKLESILKIKRYDYMLNKYKKDCCPNTLKFIHANWGPLSDLKSKNVKKYNILFDNGVESSKSIVTIRNSIAHSYLKLEKVEYYKIKDAVDWALTNFEQLPLKDEIRQKINRCPAPETKKKRTQKQNCAKSTSQNDQSSRGRHA